TDRDHRSRTTKGGAMMIEYGKANVDRVRLFYREAGGRERPTLVLLHSPATEAPLRDFLTPEAAAWIYREGTRRPAALSPDSWNMAIRFLQRPEADRIQLDLFYDYRTNVELYPGEQAAPHRHPPGAVGIPGFRAVRLGARHARRHEGGACGPVRRDAAQERLSSLSRGVGTEWRSPGRARGRGGAAHPAPAGAVRAGP